MEYIKKADYEYICNKYHDTAKPYNSLRRYDYRNDAIFSPDSGMDPDELKATIMENDKKYAHLSRPVRKARAMEYILMNTRIACDPRDIFPAINAIDRPLKSTLSDAWRKEIFSTYIPEIGAKRQQLERDGIVTMWPDFDHSVPVWDDMLVLGFAGILERSERIRRSKPRTEEEEDFFEGIRITYEAVLAFVDRLQDQAVAEGSHKMAESLARLRKGAPESFYDALLFSYIYFMISEHIDFLQVRSLSNFDRLFNRFYRSDLQQGVREETLRSQLAYYFLQFIAIGNYWNQPVYLGGENADGSTVINQLSYVFLDVYDKMGIYNPKIQIKLAESLPKDFLLKGLDMIRRGHNSIVFVSDPTMRKALMRIGATEDQARLCDVRGCYEYCAQSDYQTGMKYVNLLKPLEYTLHQGCDGVTGVFSGTVSPPLSHYKDFDTLYAEYKRQLLAIMDIAMEVANGFEDYLYQVNPLSMLSATFPTCLEKAKDALGGGSLLNTSSLEPGFLADAADSLLMIKKYVYEQKALTLEELVTMLDANFEGYELWQARLRGDREKYGNNKERPDAIAVDLANFIIDHVCGRPNSKVRGGEWVCGFHVARQSYTQGKKTAASPNGRSLGEELSKNLSPSMGQNREGATAAILSVTKIDATTFAYSAPLDLGLLPSAVQGEDGLEAMYGLVMTFLKRGGHAMQINVFDAATLRDAQKNPDNYKDLQIRVCGWNVLWNNINKEEQDGFIRQAESLV